jgi:DNA ligase 1
MSEKMDGVRAYWNGKQLMSRHGKDIKCPQWFTEALPSGKRLDGELWMGRGSFDKLRGALNSPLESVGTESLWKNEIKYVLFDMLDSELPYEERMEELRGLTLPSFVSVVEVEECRGNDHLNEVLQSIVKNNGEGIVLTKPHSLYVGERTRDRLKVKVRNTSS